QTGFNSVLLNFPGSVVNKGMEIEFKSDNIKSNSFRWSSNFNLTIPKNKLVQFPGLTSSGYQNSLVLGQPLSVLLGYQYLGVDPQTGAYRVKDQNGDGVYNNKDYVVIGNTDPKFYGGFQNTLRYKGFSLDFLFQFVK